MESSPKTGMWRCEGCGATSISPSVIIACEEEHEDDAKAFSSLTRHGKHAKTS